MSDLLTWSPIPLGRWFGTTVKVHVCLILYVAFRLLLAPFAVAADSGMKNLEQTAAWLALLLLALAIHEAAHAATAFLLDCDQEDVHLWPLGNLTGPSYTARGVDSMLVAIAGPLISGALALGIAAGLGLIADAQFVWNPFSNKADVGAPWIDATTQAAPLSMVWWIGWFGFLNYILFLVNLLPALPFDGGRLFRGFLANTSIVASKDGMIAPWTARATAAILFLVGVVRLFAGDLGDGATLIGVAVLIELFVRSESRMLEDGGFFDDGVFGYDFSEGYTSLEGSAAVVRPHRESALERWRRRRSDVRRRRRMMTEAAEERRMDEILDKLYRQGRSALTDEEQRFLIRVSARYRNRPKTQE
ncbi:site-2 protease family protein [Paludisphaera borealis]|uniref:Zinc metalloprotease Rip3 n=1 Tax=Paludisphaera borealis TaxID=1387353 RepID=A0A1U7CM34_9BACT|nr:site-2 protease family protein [Paludisphaera borealis]APW59977.1 Putative zinc metalloprotease Rip3 [Paludisphaera borealis]